MRRRRRRHRWFEVEDADGQTMRICGDPGMDRATLEALIALGRALRAMAERGELPRSE